MGGHALKKCYTRRYEREEFEKIQENVELAISKHGIFHDVLIFLMLDKHEPGRIVIFYRKFRWTHKLS